MNYSLPTWIQPPANLAAQYLSGVQVGGEIARAQQQLQQRAQMEALNASLQQQQMAQQARVDQQKIQVESAYKQQQIELQKRDLAQAEMMNALKVRDAQRQFAMRQLYQERVAAGEDPSRVMLELGPSMSEGDQSMAAAFRAQVAKRVLPPASMQTIGGENFLAVPEPSGATRYQHMPKPMPPASMQTIDGQKFLVSPQPSGAFHYQPIKGQVSAADKLRYGDLQREEAELVRALRDPVQQMVHGKDTAWQAPLTNRLAAIRQQKEELLGPPKRYRFENGKISPVTEAAPEQPEPDSAGED